MTEITDEFMTELKDVFEKYVEEVPLYQLIQSTELFIDTVKKEMKH